MKRTTPFLICTLLINSWIFSQNSNLPEQRQSFGLSLFVNNTPALKFDKFYEAGDTDVSSRNIAGFEGRISYRLQLTGRFFLESNLLFGLYPYQFDLKVEEEFAGLPWGDHDEPYFGYEENLYIGATLGISYKIPVNKKSDIAIAAGLNYIYFLPLGSTSFRIGMQVDNTTHISIYSMSLRSNPDNLLLFPPEFSLRYNYQIGKRILLSAILTYSPSRANIMDATYSITGTDKTLNGTGVKPYGHGGLGIGGYYLF